VEDVQHRQDERCRLAGAGLSPGEEVPAGEHKWDGAAWTGVGWE
jgi:hypothetical protein